MGSLGPSQPIPSGSTMGSASLTLSLSTLVPSVFESPTLELKSLPSNLKYVFLAYDDKLSVIISNTLSAIVEARFLYVLKRYNNAIGWIWLTFLV